MFEKIYFWIDSLSSNPFANKNSKAKTVKVECSNKDNCQSYKNGTCVMLINSFHQTQCPYGKISFDYGYTRRARNFHSWINKKRKEEGEDITSLTKAPNRIQEIGDYYFLPYSFVDMVLTLEKQSFIKKESFTAKDIIKLSNFIPKDMFYQREIQSYQKETVPKMLNDIRDFFPSLWEEALKEDPSLENRIGEKTFVGKTALLRTINPGKVKTKKETWYWDGEYLTTTEKNVLFLDFSSEETQVRVKPSDKAKVIIHDDNQVNKDTIILE